MPSARSFLRHPALVAGLLFCALLVRMLVPAGYMPVADGGALRLELCSGTMPAAPMAGPMAGMHHDGDRHEAPAKTEQPCAFSGLAAPALGSADPLLLTAALAFIFVAVLHGGALPPRKAPARLRPPLRAPPRPIPLVAG